MARLNLKEAFSHARIPFASKFLFFMPTSPPFFDQYIINHIHLVVFERGLSL